MRIVHYTVTALFLWMSALSGSFADDLVKENAFGPASDPAPAGARKLSEATFRKLLETRSLHIVNPALLKTYQEVAGTQLKEDWDLVRKTLGNQPELLQRLTRLPKADGDVVKESGDGNFLITVVDTTGHKQQVVTMGEAFIISEIANAIRRFPTKENQHALYTALFERLPDQYKAEKQLPKPVEVGAFDVKRIVELNISIARNLDVILRLIPIIDLDLLPAGYPGSCDKEIGYPDPPATSASDQTGARCTHNPNGLFEKTRYPLKWYATCVKNQGNRGTCVSFGVTSSVETLIAVNHNRWLNLSEEDLYNKAKMVWYPSTFGDGLNTGGIASDIVTRGYVFPFEKTWDYNPSYSRVTDTVAHTYSHSCDGYSGEHCSDTNHQGDLYCVEVLFWRFCGYVASVPGTSAYRATATAQIWNPADTASSLAWAAILLSYKTPMTIAFPVTPSFDGAPATGLVNYVGAGEGNRGGHAVAVLGAIPNTRLPAGVPQGSGGGYLILKNSWGACFKDAGYIYLPFDWVKSYAYSLSAFCSVFP